MYNSCFTKFWVSLSVMMLLVMTAAAQSRDGWYRVFTGKLGNYSGTLHLHKSTRNFCGYLWLLETQYPIKLQYKGQVNNSDSLHLSAAGWQQQVSLSGIVSDDRFAGTCLITEKDGSSSSTTFEMEVSNLPVYTRFHYYYTAGFSRLPQPYPKQPDCNYKAAAIWPEDKSTIGDSYKKQVSQFFGITTPVAEIGAWLIAEKDRYTAAWKQEHTKNPPQVTTSNSLSISLEEEINVMVMYENNRYISLAKYNFGSSGGGRGFYSTDIVTINKLSGKPVHLKDLLQPAGIAALPGLLDKTARVQYGINNTRPLDQNGFLKKRVAPAENFYITEKGLGMLFPPGSIKPFAEGEINLLVPFHLLKTYIQPGVPIASTHR